MRLVHLLVVVPAMAAFLFSPFALASDSIPAKAQERTIAIIGATIHPIVGPTIENGTIVFDKGKITAVGPALPPPSGAEVINGSKKHVYPGLISADTYLGLSEISAVRASVDRVETGLINPNVRAEAAFNPDSELIPVTRANGITMAVVAPTGKLISGTSAVMLMDGWTWEEMTLKAPAALNVTWPSMVVDKRPSPDLKTPEEQKKDRDKALTELFDAFHDARAYMNAKDAEAQKRIPYHDVDIRWGSMISALNRKIPVVVWTDEINEIEAAVSWAQRENVRLIIGGGADAWMITDLLKKNGVAVLAGGIHQLPNHTFDEYDSAYSLPAKLQKAGVTFAIITRDEAAHERNLPYQAATAASYGLPKDEALKAITLYPAQIFGVADKVGSLEVGKDATLIVTTGDPLEISSNVEIEFIQGRKVDLSSKHTRLYEKYKEKYRRTFH